MKTHAISLSRGKYFISHEGLIDDREWIFSCPNHTYSKILPPTSVLYVPCECSANKNQFGTLLSHLSRCNHTLETDYVFQNTQNMPSFLFWYNAQEEQLLFQYIDFSVLTPRNIQVSLSSFKNLTLNIDYMKAGIPLTELNAWFHQIKNISLANYTDIAQLETDFLFMKQSWSEMVTKYNPAQGLIDMVSNFTVYIIAGGIGLLCTAIYYFKIRKPKLEAQRRKETIRLILITLTAYMRNKGKNTKNKSVQNSMRRKPPTVQAGGVARCSHLKQSTTLRTNDHTRAKQHTVQYENEAYLKD